MCTVTWVHSAAGYELLANRDEKLTRAPALAPRIFERDGVRFLAPVDGDCGGTWIGVNEFGVSTCLLNGVGAARGRFSRGLLPRELLSSRSAAEAAERTLRSDLTRFAPFTLAILERGGCPRVFEWDGRGVVVKTGRSVPLVSSSFDPRAALRARRREFARITNAAGRLDAAVLCEFHRSHARGPSAYSPCMHRRDAETVSFSAIHVTAAQAAFDYTPEAPCRGASVQTTRLSLCPTSYSLPSQH